METIKAAEKALKDVFCDKYLFKIPPYQRPYSWSNEQASELLDDLLWATGVGKPDEQPPYFLGSIVVIKKSDQTEADVVDGQQRLTTLTILMSVLKQLAKTDKDREEIDIFLRQKGSSVLGTKDIPRLTIRQRDAEFFRKIIQEGDEGGIMESANTDARRRMIACRDFFLDTLQEWKPEKRMKLLTFAVRRCYLVIVEASDQASAYRIFSVMNDRGLDLSATDILKSDIIGAIASEEKQDTYNDKWEALEDGLGRDAFGDLFAHLRMIHRKQKMRGTLEREFREFVKPASKPENFIDDDLQPSAEIFERILEPDPSRPLRYRLLKGLALLDNQDWQPPAIKFMVAHHNEDDAIDHFLGLLDRLAYYLFITRANVNDRLNRYGNLLSEIETQTATEQSKALALTPEEQKNLIKTLDGEVYLNQRTRRPILLRLDEMLSDGTAHYDHKLITIEHVLPQNPEDNSEWVKQFPSDELQQMWVHRLANLVLLSRYKNPAASNYDFDYKKTKYFAFNGDSSYVLTNQVRQQSNWTPGVLVQRQEDLLNRFISVWNLTSVEVR